MFPDIFTELAVLLLLAAALTFSSTIIIVKLLSDQREVDTLHGRIALGFLIVQEPGRRVGHDRSQYPGRDR